MGAKIETAAGGAARCLSEASQQMAERRRLHRDIDVCEQHIAGLEWLLRSKLGPSHRAKVEKELDERRRSLVILYAQERGE